MTSRHRPDLIDRFHHCPVCVYRGLTPPLLRKFVHTGWKSRGTPGAIAPRGAKPGNFPFDDRHLERWFLQQQVVGGPQPGIPRSQNRDIDIHRPTQTWSGSQIIAAGLKPVAEAGVVLHVPSCQSNYYVNGLMRLDPGTAMGAAKATPIVF